MSDEPATGSAEIRDSQGSVERGSGEQRPLQARAAFLQDWDWQSVVGLNRAACTRGGAQHGQNSESFTKVGEEWEKLRSQEFTLAELLEYFRSCHRTAPFLFFNGNTFAEIARTIADFVFAELPHVRRREVISAIAHYVAGVLDRDAMVQIVESLCESASLKVGDKVKTLRGSTNGVVLRFLPDGRVVWQPNGSKTELIATPEALVLQKKGRK
jgi:hypothetical protein